MRAAVEEGHRGVVEMLLVANASISAAGYEDLTALLDVLRRRR